MKLLTPLFLAAIAFTSNGIDAQTAAKPTRSAAHPAAVTHADPHGCVKLSELSPKIPALKAGTSCPKALYTVSKLPIIKLDYVSPMEDQGVLRETFGIETSSITLAYVDTKAGTGPLVAHGKFDSLLYTGYLTDGTEFDSSAKHGNDPIVIQYGAHNVIPGWDTGLDGMRVGGKRRLFIPFELAYGASGRPPSIPAKAELIFDVELVSQSDERPAPTAPPTPPVSASPAPSAKPATPPAVAAPTTVPMPVTPPPAATQPAPTAKPQ